MNFLERFKKNDYLRSLSLDSIFQSLADYIEKCEEERDKAVAQLKEWKLADEILELQEEIKEVRTASRNGFSIGSEEKVKIDKWISVHEAEAHKKAVSTAIGGRYSYEFIPTSIGVIGTIQCSCGAEFQFCDI